MHKEVRWNEIPMAHDLGPGWRQLPQPGPQATRGRYIEEALAVPEADFHPVIVVGQVATPLLPVEAATLSVRCPQPCDQVRNIKRKCQGCRKSAWRSNIALYPTLYHPGAWDRAHRAGQAPAVEQS